MNCPKCNTINEGDSRFCSECGGTIETGEMRETPKTRRVYLYALLLIPVVILAGAVGYYKYILPSGVAAVVNGEGIKLAELDAEVGRTAGRVQAADPKLRYQVLNSLITERLILQEARKAGMTVSSAEVASALDSARIASGQSEREFEQQISDRYGSRRNFEEIFARRLLVNKFVAEKVIPANADVRSSRLAMEQWLQERSAAASVRITLAEQLSGGGAGCGCCANKGGAAAAAGPGSAGTQPRPASNAEKAANAGLQYWQEKHGPGAVTTKVTDFGCHMQVDIVKDKKIIGSLRYQAGAISEL